MTLKKFWNAMFLGKVEPADSPTKVYRSTKELLFPIACSRCGRRGDVDYADSYQFCGSHEGRTIKVEINGGMDDSLCGDCVRHLTIKLLMSMPYIVRDNPPELFPYDGIFRNRLGGE